MLSLSVKCTIQPSLIVFAPTRFVCKEYSITQVVHHSSPGPDLLDALHQPLDGDVAVCGLGRQVGLEVAGGHDGGAVIHLRGVPLLVTLHPDPVLEVIGFL